MRYREVFFYFVTTPKAHSCIPPTASVELIPLPNLTLDLTLLPQTINFFLFRLTLILASNAHTHSRTRREYLLLLIAEEERR